MIDKRKQEAEFRIKGLTVASWRFTDRNK